MKNLFLLPTDKPNRLVKFFTNKFHLCKEILPIQDEEQYQNIYITSDKKIKEGDWYINTFVSEREQKPQTHTEKRHLINHHKDYRFKYCKKIILTTDQDLIKDDVQAIDDEFLEWFVKNPSCEYVKVIDKMRIFNVDELRERHRKGLPHLYSEKIGYKIIIPKEEHKQDFVYKCTCLRPQVNCFSGMCSYCNRQIVKNLTTEDLKQKQETLEEAGMYQQELFSYLHYLGVTALQSEMQEIERIVLNMQQEQDKNKYSEEEVLEFTQTIIQQYKLGNTNIEQLDLLKETLEQFKKK
jgi:hypothetical protein